jgi:AraC-like DNA-binding protein
MKNKDHYYSHTISVIFVKHLMQSALRLGIDSVALLESAQISPQLLDQPRSRVSPEQFSQLIRSFWRTSGEESLGLASPRSKYGVFTLVAKQLLQCKDLREVLTRGSQLYNLLTDGFTMTFEADFDSNGEIPLARFCIEMNDPSVDPNHLNLVFLLIIWHRFPSWMIGDRIPLYRVELKHNRQPHSEEYRYLFPAPCEYNCDHNNFIFDARLLDKPVVANPRGLRLHLARAPLDWFIPEPYHPRQTSNLMRLFHQAPLNELPSIESAAESLNTSVRSLRRNLDAEGTGFRQLKDDYRRDQAIQLLSDTELSITEIAYRLGFDEASSFIRSFKQWTGVPPGSYRKYRLS